MAHDLDQQPSAEPRVITSVVLELILAANLVHSSDPRLVDHDPEWVKRQRRELGAEAQAYLAFAESGLEWATLSLCDYLPITGNYAHWQTFEAHVKAEPIDDFLFVVLNQDIPHDEVSKLRRQPRLAAEWSERMSCYSRMKPETAVRIFSDPEAFRAGLVAYVASQQTDTFQKRLAEQRYRLEASTSAMRERLEGKDPIALAEEIAKKPFRWPRNFQTYTFVPCHFLGRKHFYAWGGGNFLFAFNLSQGKETPSEQARELSDRMKVLGDRTRLDILRLLSDGPSYGKVIAERLELTTATVSRQLDQLKEAGLVTEDRADASNVKLVHFRKEAIAELFGSLQGFLGIPKP